MSINIKGVTVPENASHFELTFYNLSESKRETITGFCMGNIIEIPKPHDSLIDIKYVYEILIKYICDPCRSKRPNAQRAHCHGCNYKNMFLDMHKIPTVLEMEI